MNSSSPIEHPADIEHANALILLLPTFVRHLDAALDMSFRRMTKKLKPAHQLTYREASLLEYVDGWGDRGASMVCTMSHMHKSHVSTILKDFERQKEDRPPLIRKRAVNVKSFLSGLSKEEKDAINRRDLPRHTLHLTDAGRAALNRFRRAVHATVVDMMRAMPDSRRERAAFVATMQSIFDNVSVDSVGQTDMSGELMAEHLASATALLDASTPRLPVLIERAAREHRSGPAPL